MFFFVERKRKLGLNVYGVGSLFSFYSEVSGFCVLFYWWELNFLV